MHLPSPEIRTIEKLEPITVTANRTAEKISIYQAEKMSQYTGKNQ